MFTRKAKAYTYNGAAAAMASINKALEASILL
jgi:hypothetical protein